MSEQPFFSEDDVIVVPAQGGPRLIHSRMQKMSRTSPPLDGNKDQYKEFVKKQLNIYKAKGKHKLRYKV